MDMYNEFIKFTENPEDFDNFKEQYEKTEETIIQDIDSQDLEIFFKVINKMKNNLEERMKIC